MYSIGILFLSTFVITLLHIAEVYVLIRKQIMLKHYVCLFITFFIPLFLFVYFGLAPILLFTLLLNALLLIKFSKKTYTIFFFPFLYIMNCLLFYLLGLLTLKVTGLSMKELNQNIYSIILSPVAAFFISFPILLLLKHLINKRLAQFFEKIDKRVLIFTTFILCLCATLIFILASLLDNTQILFKDYILLISFIVVYTLLTIGIIYELLKSIRKSYESAKKVEYLENLNKYTENLEILYNNLRIFKHDYVNIMASMVGYFEENRYDDLKTFFYDKILPMQKNLTQNNDTLNKLQNLKILELKSILYTKVIMAVNQNVETVVDIPEEITSVNMDLVDLTRILGIYMDNAIEAARETENPIINLNMGTVASDVIIIISNSFIDKGLSPSQLQKKDVTTKGEGHGLGLYSVSEILRSYNNIYHETLIEDNMFTQQLRIS